MATAADDLSTFSPHCVKAKAKGERTKRDPIARRSLSPAARSDFLPRRFPLLSATPILLKRSTKSLARCSHFLVASSKLLPRRFERIRWLQEGITRGRTPQEACIMPHLGRDQEVSLWTNPNCKLDQWKNFRLFAHPKQCTLPGQRCRIG